MSLRGNIAYLYNSTLGSHTNLGCFGMPKARNGLINAKSNQRSLCEFVPCMHGLEVSLIPVHVDYKILYHSPKKELEERIFRVAYVYSMFQCYSSSISAEYLCTQLPNRPYSSRGIKKEIKRPIMIHHFLPSADLAIFPKQSHYLHDKRITPKNFPTTNMPPKFSNQSTAPTTLN